MTPTQSRTKPARHETQHARTDGTQRLSAETATANTPSSKPASAKRTSAEPASPAVITVDMRGRVVHWDRGAESMFGWKAKEVIGRKNPIVSKSQNEEFNRLLANLNRGNTFALKETDRKRKDGSLLQVSITATPLYNDQGNVHRCMAIISDISDRKRMEKKLLEQEERFRLLIQNSTDVVCILNPNGTYNYISPSAERMFGHRVVDRLGHSSLDNTHPDDQDMIRSAIRSAFEDPSHSVTAQYRIRHANGSWVHCEAVAKSYLHDPRIGGLVINVRDITERKRTTDAMVEQEMRFRLMVENSHDIITIRNADWTVRYTSPSMKKILGYDSADMLGQTSFENLHPEDRPRMFKAMEEFRKDRGSTKTFLYRARHKNGSWVTVEVVAQNLLDHPVIQGYIINSRDVTERKKMEEERELMFKELQEAMNKVKTLSGLLPICAACKKIRDDRGKWNAVETYVRERSSADFTHSICPDCAKRLYPDDYKGP